MNPAAPSASASALDSDDASDRGEGGDLSEGTFAVEAIGSQFFHWLRKLEREANVHIGRWNTKNYKKFRRRPANTLLPSQSQRLVAQSKLAQLDHLKRPLQSILDRLQERHRQKNLSLPRREAIWELIKRVKSTLADMDSKAPTPLPPVFASNGFGPTSPWDAAPHPMFARR